MKTTDLRVFYKRRTALQKIHIDDKISTTKISSYLNAKFTVQRMLSLIKDLWLDMKAKQPLEAADENNTNLFYEGLSVDYDLRTSGSAPDYSSDD